MKWIEDRYEHLAASAHAKEEIIYIDIAYDGRRHVPRLQGPLHRRTAARTRAYPYSAADRPADAAASLLPSHYDVRDVSFEVDAPLTNKCMIGAYRGVGWTAGAHGQGDV